MEIDETFGIIAVVPLAIKYTAVAMWRPHVNGVAGLGGLLTVQACCLSRYSHYPPPQPPAQLPQKKNATGSFPFDTERVHSSVQLSICE